MWGHWIPSPRPFLFTSRLDPPSTQRPLLSRCRLGRRTSLGRMFLANFCRAFCPCDVTSSSSSCVAGGTRETRQQRRNNRTSFSDSRFECRKLTRIMKLYHVAQKPYLFARPVNAVIKSRRRDGRFLAPRDPGGA